jgi:hypothetical protein
MTTLTRRQFLKGLGSLAASALIYPWLRLWDRQARAREALVDVYVARNGTPVSNVQRVVALTGGIQRFIDHDDVVVLKPNGQWPNQGYTHTQSLKALIDVILARPGGFGGEIIIIEHVHTSPSNALSGNYCWNMSVSNRTNNWADMNYFELMDDYHNRSIPIVTADPLYDSGQGTWDKVTGPSDVAAGRQGWVHTTFVAPANGRTVRLPYPILRSSYSGKLIDLKNGVWQGGGYTGQKVKLIFLPTLNNHGSFNSEDFAGPTSALKTHIGIVDFAPSTGVHLHGVGYDVPISPQAMGEAVGQLITQILSPSFYLTVAEYTGYRGRTDTIAAHTKTVGLCADPVTLDYWMNKYVMYPCATSQTFMNPDNDNHLRQALVGCHSRGVGTYNEAEMAVHIDDPSIDKRHYLPLVVRGI